MRDWSTLADTVERLHKARVLVVGDVMLDRFIYGTVGRISPEAPVPVLAYRETKAALGGAGNVVRNLSTLGAQVGFITVVGNDAEAQEIGSMLSALDGTVPSFIQEQGRQTIMKTRFIAERQQVMRLDRESPHDIDRKTEEKILREVAEYLRNCDIVVLSDYGKGMLCRNIPAAIIDQCRKAGKTVLVDPKGKDYTRYAGANIITPNLKELHDATGMPVQSDDDIIAAARHLIGSCRLDALLATRSQDGMTLVRADGSISHMRAEAKEVFDVSGAGDTVIAVAAASLGVGASLETASELANIAAGIVVGKAGTAVVHKKDIFHALHQQEMSGAESKVMELEEAADIAEVWRRKGKTVGFTNGIFDLLQPAHISLLSQAAKVCDRLIVGINSDSSVASARGEAPVQHETARSSILASLEGIHAVVIYKEETPVRALELLRPDVLIKGANYRPEEVVGAELVQGYGGKVHLVQIESDQYQNAKLAGLTKGAF
jgi:D-beta-D-heptose 7-phosphate kinase/D-beta-D-heptose 1-phosphate adenosyltransferase